MSAAASKTPRSRRKQKKTEKDEDRKALREQIRRLDTERARLRRLQENLESGAPR